MKVVKSVSFNDKNPEESEMIRMFRRKSFSKYVKELIREDMARKKAVKVKEENPKEVENKPRQYQAPAPEPSKPKVFRGGIKFEIKE